MDFCPSFFSKESFIRCYFADLLISLLLSCCAYFIIELRASEPDLAKEEMDSDDEGDADLATTSSGKRKRGTWQSSVNEFLEANKETEKKELRLEKQKLALEIKKEGRLAAEQKANAEQSAAMVKVLNRMLALIQTNNVN